MLYNTPHLAYELLVAHPYTRPTCCTLFLHLCFFIVFYTPYSCATFGIWLPLLLPRSEAAQESDEGRARRLLLRTAVIPAPASIGCARAPVHCAAWCASSPAARKQSMLSSRRTWPRCIKSWLLTWRSGKQTQTRGIALHRHKPKTGRK